MDSGLLEIKDLHVNFQIYEGTLRVLDGVNFKVGVKEKIGLIGEAGCGKTTTMKAILKILPPQRANIPEGEILFEGKDVLRMDHKEIRTLRRRHIAMIFQDATAALNPVFKIGEQLFPIIKYARIEQGNKNLGKREIKAEAIEVLKSVALPDPERILQNYPIQLSGGMRQRVCIASALVAASDLLIADEPGTALDVTIEHQVLQLLNEVVQARGVSVILISHALGAVRGLVDRVYVMYAGSTVEVAETEEIFENPTHPYTSRLLNAVPKLSGGGVPKGISGRIPDYLHPPTGCRFHPRCDTAMPICREKKPQIVNVGGGHMVACHLYQRQNQ